MANKQLIAIFVVCIVVATAMQLPSQAAANFDYVGCFTGCESDCRKDNGQTFCEMKCDNDCLAKQAAVELNLPVN